MWTTIKAFVKPSWAVSNRTGTKSRQRRPAVKPSTAFTSNILQRFALSLALIAMSLSTMPSTVEAKTYACPRPDGTTLYTDRQLSGCLSIELKPLNPVPRTPMKAEPSPGQIKLAPEPSQPRNPGPKKNYFETAVRYMPALAYTGGYGPNHVPQAGAVRFHKMTVRHLASGSGPTAKSEATLDQSADESLHVAAKVAAQAVGYDPGFLEVEMRPMDWLQLEGSYLTPMPVFGNSASGMWTIAIAAALLGDELRSDVCMTGAISSDASIGFVGKVDQKAFGCINGQYREMLMPTGQADITVVSNLIGRGVTITEVSDLAQAYEIVTGRSMRKFSAAE